MLRDFFLGGGGADPGIGVVWWVWGGVGVCVGGGCCGGGGVCFGGGGGGGQIQGFRREAVGQIHPAV